jgi:hypothetical protein
MSSIAFSTDPTGAINTLADLIAEVRDEMDDSGYAQQKILRAITRAEAIFNRELRVPRMETELQFTATNEITPLPADFLQMRSIYQEGAVDRPLRSMSPDGIRRLYMGQAGAPAAYAVENRSLVLAPVGNTAITMLYYAAIPALTEANPQNWLLFENPDLYLHQVLAILFAKLGDDNRAVTNLSIASGLIERANEAGRRARWGASPLTPLLVQQVPGVRI